ncbi:MAG: trigger factor [Rickettsiales bacterium]|jgi:trigger factor|nr:trigger factor [Rickettsiales bacterium]
MFKKEKIKDLHYSVSGLLTAAEIQAASDGILQKYGEKAKIPGFRQGHVPVSVLRQKYGNASFSEAVDNLMNADMDAFAREKNLRLAGSPKADITKFAVGEDVEYVLEFDVLPTLPAISLEKYTLTRKIAKIEDSEVKKSLENLRKSRAQAELQGPDYKAAIEDVAVIDFKGFLGNEPFDGGEAKKHHLILGSGSFIPGFEEKIIGHKVGDAFDINVKFPKDYHAENLAGRDARFEVMIHELRHHVLPILDDGLAKSVGMESIAALTEHIKKVLGEQYVDAANKEMRNELLDLLADKVRLNLPETLIAQEYEMAKSEFEKHSGHAHAKDAKFDEKKEREDAEHRVKLGLILAEWGSANGVVVTNEDLQKAIWAEAARYPNPHEIFEFYDKNPNAVSMIRGMLFEQKALDAMIAKTKVKEKLVKPEDLFKQAKVK